MGGDRRSEFLSHQRRRLCPAALSQGGGRAFPEDEHPYRTDFQRDRDRVLHCSAFRRLDYKTQVFVPHEQDHFRTRLTHTLEVAQVARTLARALRANEDAVEAVALAHDLGHAPFGHAGEAALDELMAEHGGFEHNRQTLRVVDYLEHPYPQFRGLNLTRAVRLCLAKHTTRYDSPGATGSGAVLAPLEGQLVDLADEIAYTSADLADALAAGWVSTVQLAELQLWQQAWEGARRALPEAGENHLRIRACGNVLAMMADAVIEQTSRRLEEVQPGGPQDVQQAGRPCAGFGEDLGPLVQRLQQFLHERVYLHPLAREHQAEARQVITRLFEAYASDPALLPGRYLERVGQEGRHRVLCDYIAGMTDRYCRRQYEEILHRER